jgi:hypothetical protein
MSTRDVSTATEIEKGGAYSYATEQGTGVVAMHT